MKRDAKKTRKGFPPYFWRELGLQALRDKEKKCVDGSDGEVVPDEVQGRDDASETGRYLKLATYNCNGLSVSGGSNKKRRGRVEKNILKLTKGETIVLLQETHVEKGADPQFFSALPKWKMYHSGLSAKKAGVATLIPPTVVQKYDVQVLPQGVDEQGYLLALRLVPKEAQSKLRTHLIVNFYGKQINKMTALTKQLTRVAEYEPAECNWIAGDFNFVEDPGEPTYVERTEKFVAAWDKVQKRFKVREVYQPLPTRFGISTTLKEMVYSRLDRIYASLDELDYELVQPYAHLPNVPRHVLNAFKHLAPSPEGEVTGLVKKVDFCSDHVPVKIGYAPPHTEERLPRIRKEEAKDPRFKEAFKKRWAEKVVPDDPLQALDELDQCFYDSVREVRRRAKEVEDGVHDDVTRFTAAVALYKALSQTTPDFMKANALAQKYSELGEVYANAMDGSLEPNLGVVRAHVATVLTRAKSVEALEYEQTLVGQLLGISPQNRSFGAKLGLLLPSVRKRLRALRVRPDAPPSSDPKVMCRAAKEYWSGVWSKDPSAPPRWKIARALGERRPRGEFVAPGVEAVKDVILKTNDSSPGPNGVPFACYRATVEWAGPIFHRLFMRLAKGGRANDYFNLGVLYLLPKKDTGLASDTRPISVTNSSNRIIAKILIGCILPHIQEFLNESQRGSIAGRRGEENIRRINELLHAAIDDPEAANAYFLFIDTRKAFDSIHHEFIKEALYKFGLPVEAMNVIDALLEDVAVTPMFGGYSGTWISIERGVKQGCPLSPLIFAICVDVLLVDLAKVEGVLSFAYVDDMSIYTKVLGQLRTCMSRIDNFSCLSGLGINRDKTAFMSARHDPILHDLLRKGLTSWGRMDYVTKYKYLGVWTGPRVTLEDVYSGPIQEMARRLRLYREAFRHMTPFKRIVVYNTYVFPLVSYVAYFHPIPLESDKGGASFETVRDLVRRYVLPFGGLKYLHAIRVDGVRPPVPLKDVWAYSIAMIAARTDLRQFQGHRRAKKTVRCNPSLRMSTQDLEIANDFVAWSLYVARDGVDSRADSQVTFDSDPYIGEVKKVRRSMYKVLVKAHVKYEKGEEDLRKKLKARTGKEVSAQTVVRVHGIFQRVSQKTPKAAVYHQFLTYFNANRTQMRVRHLSPDIDLKCLFCETGKDEAHHNLGECEGVGRARERFFGRVGVRTDEDRWAQALLLTGEWTESGPTSVVLFNWAVFHTARCAQEPRDTARNVRKVLSTAMLAWERMYDSSSGEIRTRRDGRGFGSTSARSETQTVRLTKTLEALLRRQSSSTVVLYTDGSAKGNPGPAGAGVYATDLCGNEMFNACAALGHGTNNIGEAWAIGLAITLVLRYAPGRDALVLTDSKNTRDLVNHSAAPSENVTLIRRVRETITAARTSCRVTVAWIGGHAGICGNEHADRLAELGMERSVGLPEGAVVDCETTPRFGLGTDVVRCQISSQE